MDLANMASKNGHMHSNVCSLPSIVYSRGIFLPSRVMKFMSKTKSRNKQAACFSDRTIQGQTSVIDPRASPKL